MAVMRRGSNVSLSREVPGLKSLILGVHWDANREQALSDSLVVATVLCDEHSKALSNDHFVFFNQLSSPEESVTLAESTLGSDLEQIEVDLDRVPADVSRIAVVLYINAGLGLRRTLGQLHDCTVRVVNTADGKELVRSENLATSLSSENALSLGEVYRHQGEWKFKVIGDGYSTGVVGLAADYGIAL
jgi:tellurium resistance protein TerD